MYKDSGFDLKYSAVMKELSAPKSRARKKESPCVQLKQSNSRAPGTSLLETSSNTPLSTLTGTSTSTWFRRYPYVKANVRGCLLQSWRCNYLIPF